MIILDYGRDVGGLPVFDPSLQLPALQTFKPSTARPSTIYLLPDGAAAAPGKLQDPNVAQAEVSFVENAAGANLSSLDTCPLTRTGLIVERLVQGGERFEAITLASPGSVTIREVSIQAKFFIPQQTKNCGSFSSSDRNA